MEKDREESVRQEPPRGRRGMPVEKAKDFKGTWKKLFKYCDKYTLQIIAAIICAFAGTALTIIGPQKIKDMVNIVAEGLLTGIDLAAVTKQGLILGAMYLIGALLNFTQTRTMRVMSVKISNMIRRDISRKINRLPISYYKRGTIGDVLSRVTNDVMTISMTISDNVSGLVSSCTLFAGALIMMFVTNAVLALTALAATIIGFIVLIVIRKKSQKYFRKQQKALGMLNGHIEEMFSGHTVVKAYNGERKAKEEFDSLNGKLRYGSFKAQALSGLMMPLMVFIGNLAYVAVCVVGAYLTINGKIGFGVIVAFVMYVRYFTQPLSQIAQAMQGLQSGAAAGERVFEFLEAAEMEDESDKTQRIVDCEGKVEFEHVKFGYDESKVVIKDFSAVAAPGKKIAIVGPTGAGKTTLVNLLMRFYETDGGRILIDGIPSSELTRSNVHDLFCMVLQDTWLFEGTIRENLIYCNENVSDETLVKACKAVGLDHFIRTLPMGYDTVLGDTVSLSAGQKQQMTIARAMIANKPMLILDEATSSVDTRTEAQIQKAMDELMEGRTSFVIAHRLSTIKNADLILVVKGGDIVESGTHEELLAAKGFYAELYNSQFEECD